MSAGAELVGMAEYDYDSDEDDLLDYDSDAGSHHPSRECMVVEAGGGSRRNVHDVAAQPDLAAAATTADAGAAAEAAPLLVTQAQQETPPASADRRGGDDLERLLQRQHELAEAARRLKEERERLERESIILTQACARELQNSSGDSLLASSLEASLSAKDDSLKVSSAAASDLLAEVEVLRGHKSSLVSDLSILEEKIREKKASLEKEKLFNEHLSAVQALGVKYDEVPADVSLEVMNEWLRLSLASLAEICRSFSYDAVVLMIQDLLHSFSCEGSDAVDLVGRSDFSMKPSDLSHDFGAVEGKCVGLINEFWWNRVKCLVLTSRRFFLNSFD
ncbi:hypothetical protein EJB05_05072, partial [Eragrostis curvula]